MDYDSDGYLVPNIVKMPLDEWLMKLNANPLIEDIFVDGEYPEYGELVHAEKGLIENGAI